jgi:hypothetical protein
MKKNSRILVLSDMHHPYAHKDTVAFLKAVKAKYKPDRIVCIGDEIDNHAISFHATDPNLPSAGDELQLAIEALQPLYKLFPKVDVLTSNHGSLHYRKGLFHGMPKKFFKDYNDVLDAPAGWQWHSELVIKAHGNDILFHHGLSPNGIKVVKERGLCFVQGHYHTKCEIGYSSTPDKLLWNMTVGCSIDPKSPAFAYAKLNVARQIIAHGIIIDGQPKLLPMLLNKAGRWTRFVP